MERVKILLLIIIMSLFGTSGTANYNKLAYDFTFKGIDGNQSECTPAELLGKTAPRL